MNLRQLQDELDQQRTRAETAEREAHELRRQQREDQEIIADLRERLGIRDEAKVEEVKP